MFEKQDFTNGNIKRVKTLCRASGFEAIKSFFLGNYNKRRSESFIRLSIDNLRLMISLLTWRY